MRGLSLFLVVGVFACKKADDLAAAAKPPPPKPVKLAPVQAQVLPTPVVLTLTGTVAADQRSDVTADTQGKVINVMIQRGDHVRMGQPVIQLDVRTAALGAREAQAQLGAARAQKELAEQECARTKSLLEKGAITRSEYDRQSTQCTSSLEQVAGAQARAEMMAKSVADGLVRAPFEGEIAEKMVSPGEWVAPGKPLFTLVDKTPLKIELSVPEAAVPYVKAGQDVDVRAVAQPEKSFHAKVTRLGSEIGRTRSLIVEATIDPTEELVPGMFAEASIAIGKQPHVVLPKSAIAEGQRNRAFVLHSAPTWLPIMRKWDLEERIVQLGYPPDAEHVTVLQGVAAGERVAPDAQAPGITDGAPVQE
jgi:membrane fusion protein (multidrug efflux system)